MRILLFASFTLLSASVSNHKHVESYEDLCVVHPDYDDLMKDLATWQRGSGKAGLEARASDVFKDFNIKKSIADLYFSRRSVSFVTKDLDEQILNQYNDGAIEKFRDDAASLSLVATSRIIECLHEQDMKMELLYGVSRALDLTTPHRFVLASTLRNLTGTFATKIEQLLVAFKAEVDKQQETKNMIKEHVLILVKASQLVRQEFVLVAGRSGPATGWGWREENINQIYKVHKDLSKELKAAGLKEEAEQLAAAQGERTYVNGPHVEESQAEEPKTEEPQEEPRGGYLKSVLLIFLGIVIGAIGGVFIGKYAFFNNKIDLLV